MNGNETQAMSGASLTTLDLSDFHGDADRREAFLGDLLDVLYQHGFLYLTGHGVDQGLIDQVLAASKRFFALPLDDRLQIEMVRSPHFRGYNRAGLELTRGQQDWREQLDINTEAAPFPLGPDTPAWRRLQGPNLWPDAMPELKQVLLAYQAEVTRVGIELLKAIAAALGQPENAFAEIYEPGPSQLMKIIRYPGRDVAQTDQGVGAHRDGGFVTVLLQDRTPGLRVQADDGSWIAAPPVAGTFVINAGELLELATNGLVRAAIHDVVAPPAGDERFSVAFFLGSRPDAVVPVIPLSEDLKRAERGLSVDPLNPIFREVGQNQLKSRLRSHPDVAAAHYADVLNLIERPADG
ncbi:isopenicillin N synthase family dioxygenase [Brevundimonas nasdae]|uniref:isopenicillin N synthase family dioxygenase n=1 Tax=Brevundimonas nasdae TaxID=172043 RepID=UPI003F69063F